MNNNMLIGTAMLSAYLESENKDTLDLLIPFIKYSIAETTKVKDNIDIHKLTQYFQKTFGYETIPTNVIISILNRLSPEFVTKNCSRYYLKVTLDQYKSEFEKKYIRFSEQRERVASALVEFLNTSSIHNYTVEQAINYLIDFFAVKGFFVLNDTDFLEFQKRKDDAVSYAIGQFVVSEYKKDSTIFKYIVDMVKGFFASSAIAFYSQNISPIVSKFKNFNCYIDTRLIINALGMHLPEEKTSSLELLNMLKDKGAILCCFEHNFKEIDDIITAYRNGLIKTHNSGYYHPALEGWDERNYTVTDVERFQVLLRQRINDLGIEIVQCPAINNETDYPFDYKSISSFIKENINYRNDDALDKDIKSVASILLLRKGFKTTEFEKSREIFVTSNIRLARFSNIFLSENSICDFHSETVPTMTDVDLSSIVWLKCFNTHKDFPKHRLIELSMAALEPTSTIMNSFNEFVEKIKGEGLLTEDEAAIIRTDAFCRKELSKIVKGDASKVTQETIIDIRNRVKDKYLGDERNAAQLNYNMYLKEKDEQRKKQTAALTKIRDYERKIYRIAYASLAVILGFFIAACFIIAGVVTFFSAKDLPNLIVIIATTVIGVISAIDMFIPKMRFLNRVIIKLSKKIATIFSDKKKDEYSFVLDENVNDI